MADIGRLFRLPHLILLKLKLRLHGVVYGRRIRGNRVYIRNAGKITIGDNVSLNSFPRGEPYRTGLQTHCRDAVLSIGDHCTLNGTMIHCRTAVTIGHFCMFGPGSRLVDNDSHRTSIDVTERRKPPRSAPIHVHDNVWIGANSLILKGVEIGQNSIIAAHSVVTKSVPENTLVAGNPARIVRTLTK